MVLMHHVATAVAAAVSISVDLSASLSMSDGPATFSRSTFINAHSMANEAWKPEQVAVFGDNASAGGLSVAFGRDIGRANWILDQSKKLAPGTVDPASVAQKCARFTETDPLYAKSFSQQADQLQYIESINVQFWYQDPPATWKPQDWAFFPRGNNTEISSLYTTYIDNCVDRASQGAIVVECMNEPEVHVAQLNITFDDVIETHIAIARAMHAEFGRLPQGSRGPYAPTASAQPLPVRVAGPTAAWPTFQMRDFDYFKEGYGKFIEQAGADMDLLSIHLYDTYHTTTEAMHVLGPWNESSWETRRIGGNIEAVLDLIESVSAALPTQAASRPVPMEVSEYGTSFVNWKDRANFTRTTRGFWAILIGVCGKLLALIDRSDTIVKAVPFLIHDGAWYHGPQQVPFTLFAPPNASTPTALVTLYQVLDGVHGVRVHSAKALVGAVSGALTQDAIQHVVLLGSDAVYVLLNNLESAVQPNVTVALGNVPAGRALAATATLRVLAWSEEADAPVVTTAPVAVPVAAGGPIALPEVPENAFVVLVVPMTDAEESTVAPAAAARHVHRWRLTSVWDAPKGAAFPVLSPAASVAVAVANISRALPPLAAVVASSSVLTAVRACLSSYSTPQELAATPPRIGFANSSGSVTWADDAMPTFQGFSGRSPDELHFFCVEYDTRGAAEAQRTLQDAVLSSAAAVLRPAVGMAAGSAGLQLSSVMLFVENEAVAV